MRPGASSGRGARLLRRESVPLARAQPEGRPHDAASSSPVLRARAHRLGTGRHRGIPSHLRRLGDVVPCERVRHRSAYRIPPSGRPAFDIPVAERPAMGSLLAGRNDLEVAQGVRPTPREFPVENPSNRPQHRIVGRGSPGSIARTTSRRMHGTIGRMLGRGASGGRRRGPGRAQLAPGGGPGGGGAGVIGPEYGVGAPEGDFGLRSSMTPSSTATTSNTMMPTSK